MAKKQKALSTAEIFYINEKAKSGCSKEEIASNLGLTIEQIDIHYPEKLPRKDTALQKSMKRRTEKGRKVSVMTPGASQIIDDTKISVRMSGRDVDCIHRPLGEE